MNRLPGVIGVSTGIVAFSVSGIVGGLWFAAGVFMGGWVPLYLMPWLRERS